MSLDYVGDGAKRLPVAEHLSDFEYKVLMQTYARHNSAMGLSERSKYTLSHIVKVDRNLEDNCLNVHYDSGEWWKYYSDYTWG